MINVLVFCVCREGERDPPKKKKSKKKDKSSSRKKKEKQASSSSDMNGSDNESSSVFDPTVISSHKRDNNENHKQFDGSDEVVMFPTSAELEQQREYDTSLLVEDATNVMQDENMNDDGTDDDNFHDAVEDPALVSSSKQADSRKEKVAATGVGALAGLVLLGPIGGYGFLFS